MGGGGSEEQRGVCEGQAAARWLCKLRMSSLCGQVLLRSQLKSRAPAGRAGPSSSHVRRGRKEGLGDGKLVTAVSRLETSWLHQSGVCHGPEGPHTAVVPHCLTLSNRVRVKALVLATQDLAAEVLPEADRLSQSHS